MKWFDKNKEPPTRYRKLNGIARIVQINDSIVAINSEIEALENPNTAVAYTLDYGLRYERKLTIAQSRNKLDASTFLAVQDDLKAACVVALKSFVEKLGLESK